MESSECSSSKSLPQQRSHQGQTANRSSSSSMSSEQEYLPFPAVFGSDLEHSLDHKPEENLFSNIQFSPHASEYSNVDPTTPEQFQSSLSPFTMDTLFSTNSTKCTWSIRNSLVHISNLTLHHNHSRPKPMCQLLRSHQTTISATTGLGSNNYLVNEHDYTAAKPTWRS